MLFLYGQYFAQKQIDSSNLLSVVMTQLKQLVCSAHVMIYKLMSTDDLPANSDERNAYIKDIDDHIKIFLSCCHRFAKSYYDNAVAEFWFTKSNFISLLNLPEQIAKFGPLGYYWDGTFEVFIQGPKAVLQNARKNPASLMTKMTILQRMSFMEKIRKELGLDVGKGTKKRYYGVRICESSEEVFERWEGGMCISCYTRAKSPGYFYVPYRSGSGGYRVIILESDLSSDIRHNNFGLYQCKFTLPEIKQPDKPFSISMLDKKTSKHVDQYCVLFPNLERNEQFQSYYSVVTHTWKVLRSDGTIGGSEICREVFSRSNLALPS